ncbi:hypothetical protein QYF61_002574 [Mycteria americana]|uniref:Large ribosomal subunit protein bL20m n=2 Tax=Ciconiidae TaxID=8926 RepID=A0AAN7N6V6_MYCAM|nr:hypothetical protein QYF61_002574 [Mycteria americana]
MASRTPGKRPHACGITTGRSPALGSGSSTTARRLTDSGQKNAAWRCGRAATPRRQPPVPTATGAAAEEAAAAQGSRGPAEGPGPGPPCSRPGRRRAPRCRERAAEMVLLSAPCWLRSRLTDRFWRVQEVLKYARHFRGRKNRCYKLAVRSVRRAFVKSTKARREKKRFLRALWITRIEAASLEHGLKYPAFISNLIKSQVELNRKMIADLAIYEPKTFKSLAALAQRRRQEGFLAALGDGKEPEGIFSRIVHHY